MPLEAGGARKDHVIAFMRLNKDESALCVCGRFFTALAKEGENPCGEQAWLDTFVRLPEGYEGANFTDCLSSRKLCVSAGTLQLKEVFEYLPAAMLVKQS